MIANNINIELHLTMITITEGLCMNVILKHQVCFYAYCVNIK